MIRLHVYWQLLPSARHQLRTCVTFAYAVQHCTQPSCKKLFVNCVLDFVHRPDKIRKYKITTFRKLVLLPSSGEGRGDTYLDRANLSHWTLARSKGPILVGVSPSFT
jgi:hypothetical protein